MTCSVMSASFLFVAGVILAAAPSSAITAEEFRLRSGTDIVALCATPVTDPLHAAAIHMCHGFGAGTFQTIMALTRHEKLEPLICPPAPTPSRNETVAKFLDWAKGNPEHLTEPAVETIGRFFLSEFPCRR
jgi:hypothetical protein